MINARSAAAVAVFAALLSGCSSMTSPRYSVSANNNVILKKLPDVSASIVEQMDNSHFDAGCRMAGPISPSDNRTLAQFIADSFNDEFKFADKFGEKGAAAKLNLTLDKAKFSSVSGLTNGWWELGVTLKNKDTGDAVSAETHYDFNSAFDGMQACNLTAQALAPAVQDLIQKVVVQRDFRRVARMATPSTAAAP